MGRFDRLEAVMTVPSGATVSATNSGGGPTSVSLTAGAYTPTEYVAHLVARLNAVRTPANWSGSLSTGASGTGLVTLNCTGTWALTFTTAEAGTVIGFVGDIGSRSSAATGTQNARGLWQPDCPVTMDLDLSIAPEQYVSVATTGPTGETVTLIGPKKYKHTGVSWSHVARSLVWAGSEATTYASWQSWIRDTQWGVGHTWFTPGSAFQVYWTNAGSDAIVGADLGSTSALNKWHAPVPINLNPERASQGWDGMWRISIGAIVSTGS